LARLGRAACNHPFRCKEERIVQAIVAPEHLGADEKRGGKKGFQMMGTAFSLAAFSMRMTLR